MQACWYEYPPVPSLMGGRFTGRKATASYHLDPNLNSQARQGAAVNRTLVLLGAAAILGAIITQPSAFGHR